MREKSYREKTDKMFYNFVSKANKKENLIRKNSNDGTNISSIKLYWV